MKKVFLHVALVVAIVASLQSCKKDKCDGIICSADQTCVDGTCVDNVTSEVVSGFINENTTWTSDNIYELSGRVVVNSGVTLTIEAGTVIKGQEGSGTEASVLVIARGAKIMAEGTASSPIVFTSVIDNIQPGSISGSNLEETDNELWGGLVILGYAPISAENGDVEGQIEGLAATETYGKYGGDIVADNSGILKYVSIRHGGITIGDGNEINGLTLGGVGSGTTIENIEIVANLDDGVEFFGGTVNVTNVIVVYQGDDGLDIDQNYSGTIDNAIVITGDGIGTDEALEVDGPEGSTYSNGLFTITNSSFWTEGTDGSAADLKSKAQGTITNCTFEGFTSGIKVRASYSDTTACTGKSDAYSYLTSSSPTLVIQNNKFEAASIADYISVYTGSCASCGCADAATELAAETVVSADGNTASSAISGGADRTAFTWTWASNKGKL